MAEKAKFRISASEAASNPTIEKGCPGIFLPLDTEQMFSSTASRVRKPVDV